ncbi:MAG: hypothetical protein L0Z46_02175 [Nitrospiraceae bacterium]|nr:hypothetical protein [Nitrospiraceae bacterium]
MKKFSQIAIAVLTLPGMISLSSIVHAQPPYLDKILTHISMNSDGTVFIKWTGSPRPSPTCSGGGDNFGWVKIRPTANEAIKALALSIYFSGKLARIDTSGCDGPYEIVTSLYSPGG